MNQVIPKLIIYRCDYEALLEGKKIENLKVFNSWDDVPGWQRDTPNAFFIEVELNMTREDILKLFGTNGRYDETTQEKTA